ncbi:septation protein SepH [Cellulomonas alba]|uniref:Septation protein SepH n=1 Tax=Cellulomonas alba TaxID=3053467 RepID=A0ABT7SBK1_9CELL|nr:septation protein SepH [Cellulomonas alba]MDM7853572.1 septation protein SepH [Cellulomonas alba]
MGELELVGLHEDGEHLVLAAPDGQRFRLRIDEPLRAAVRRDRPQLEQLRAEGAGTLSPREIQARIRAGATTQEVADASGLPVEHVRRYEGPVLAEREYVAEQARATRVGRDSGAPALGDLVTDRLAARGVDLGSLSWDAAREPSGPWLVLARFAVGDVEHEARWTFDVASRALVADEDEARWLSETELPDEPVARRHLAAVRDVVFDFTNDVPTLREPVVAAAEPQVADPEETTHSLLDDLRSRRGVRQPVELDEDAEEFEGFGPQRAFDFGRLDAAGDPPGAHPGDADERAEAVVLRPAAVTAPVAPPGSEAPAAAVDPVEHHGHAADDEPRKPRSRRERAKVPSWDEIVFGAKPE